MPRLERALRGLAPGVSYVGQVYSYENSPDYASGGAGYGMRRAALASISGENQRCKLVPSEHTNYEDVSVGACLHQHGVSVTQLDGLYGDNARDSALLASGALVFRNHRFTVNVTIPVLTMHKSSELDCMGSTVLACASTRLAHARKTRPQPPPLLLAQVTVLVQFNFPTQEEELAEFVRSWSKLCPTSNIILAMPLEHKLQRNHTQNDHHNPRVHYYTGDAGFYSPIRNIIKAIADSNDAKGVLYVHGDMLLQSSLLSNIATDEWVATLTETVPFRWLRNGSFSGSIPPTSWSWWRSHCTHAFGRIAKDPRMDQVWGTRDGLDVQVGQSNMLYVSTTNRTQMAAFGMILDIFAKHQLFLECAIPSAVAIMQQIHSVRVRKIHLCTCWTTEQRNNPDAWPCLHDPKYSAIHPVKPLIKNNRWGGQPAF